MKFIVIYNHPNSGALFPNIITQEQFDTHASALKFIEEVIKANKGCNLMYLIHGAILET